MRLLPGIFLLFIAFLSACAQASDRNSPYLEITVNGLEEIAPPLSRLADAVEELSQSENFSIENQQKIISIIDEMKLLTDKFDSSIDLAKQKVSQTQEEISASIRQIIKFALLGLLAMLIIIGASLFYLFRYQVRPLVNTTLSSLGKLSMAMDNLSIATKALNHQRPSLRK